MAANIIIVAVVGLAVFLAVRKIVKDRKNNKCACGGSCGGCSSAGECNGGHEHKH